MRSLSALLAMLCWSTTLCAAACVTLRRFTRSAVPILIRTIALYAGEFTYASGAKYAGQWVGNKYNGHGKYLYPDGSFYEGNWADNQMHGAGVFVDTKGIQWKGQFYNGTGPGLNALVV